MKYQIVFSLVGLLLSLTSGFELQGFLNPDIKLDTAWKDFVTSYNKSYQTDAEMRYRRAIWEYNLATIFRHNEETALGKHTYMMGVNNFTDWTFEDFASRYLSTPRVVEASPSNMTDSVDVDLMNDFDEKDWRNQGAVTPVKNQGRCGSCWSFSTTGSIEGQNAIKHGKLLSLSEQQLIDCCRGVDRGCDGGLVTETYQCIKAMGGLDTETSYTYEGKQDRCRFKRSDIAANVIGYKVNTGQPYLHSVVQQVGPASVLIYATSKLQHYKSGIFSDSTCNIGHINHAVLTVGYGDGYWLVKNSWGASWGEKGYFRMARSTSGVGMCMIGYQVSFPIV